MDSLPAPASGSLLVEDEIFCPQCGYILRGLVERRCPECGLPFDPAELTASVLPWLHRRRLGRVRAYLQTLRLAVLRPGQLADQIRHRQPYPDSQSFRWITVALAWLPVLFATMVNWDGRSRYLFQPPDAGGDGIAFAAFRLAAAAMVYTVLTALPSYFFHPRRLPVEIQNRGVALSYYACAPLAAAPLLFPFGWIVHGLFGQTAGFWAAQCLLVLPFVPWWYALVLLTRRLEMKRPVRAVCVSVAVPILWAVVGNAIGLLGVQVMEFVAFAFLSLRECRFFEASAGV